MLNLILFLFTIVWIGGIFYISVLRPALLYKKNQIKNSFSYQKRFIKYIERMYNIEQQMGNEPILLDIGEFEYECLMKYIRIDYSTRYYKDPFERGIEIYEKDNCQIIEDTPTVLGIYQKPTFYYEHVSFTFGALYYRKLNIPFDLNVISKNEIKSKQEIEKEEAYKEYFFAGANIDIYG